MIAVTAGEAENPETSIPRAMRTMVLRLILFYVLAISVMLMMTPWSQLAEGGSGITGSPFVRAFAAAGIPYAAGVMNLVVISAAISSANSNLYMTDADAVVAVAVRLRARAGLRASADTGVPLRAVAIASSGMAVGDSAGGVSRRRSAFLALYGTAVAGMLFIWIVILFTYLRFRAALVAGAARAAADPHAGAPRRRLVRHRLAGRDRRDDVLRGRLAVQRVVVPAVSRQSSRIVVRAHERQARRSPGVTAVPSRGDLRRGFRRWREPATFVFFDNAAGAQMSRHRAGGGHRPSVAAQRAARRALPAVAEVDAMIARARESVAAFVNAPAPTRSRSASMPRRSSGRSAWRWARRSAPRAEIIVSDLDHEANIATWLALRARRRAHRVVAAVRRRRAGCTSRISSRC